MQSEDQNGSLLHMTTITKQSSPVRWLTDNQYENLPIAHRSIAWADSQVGVREQGRNRGRQVEEYQRVAGLGRGGGYAWCACFVTWCLIQAGAKWCALPKPGLCAAVRNWASWAEESGRLRSTPKRGDLFFWLDSQGRGHIGFVLSTWKLDIIRTIEGNTDGEAGSRDGDGVYKRTRTLRSFQKRHRNGFIDLSNLKCD
ncbi:MAG: CHAP domain-containing protein [Fimbriimonadaceae bacterium]